MPASPVKTDQCPLCGGTGFKPVPGGDSSRKAPQVVRCDCRQEQKAGRLLANARIPKRYEHCELGDFHADYPGAHSSLASARLAAGRFVEEYPVDERGLLLVGSIGTGKTDLAVSIIRALIETKGVPCVFMDYRELLKEIQNSYNPQVNATELAILRPLFEIDVLVLDELGAVRPSEWVWDTVSLLLNSRYNNRKTTIITTNYPEGPAATGAIDQIKRAARQETLGDRIGDRMRSRLIEMCRIVKMEGADFRQKVQSANFR